MRCGRRAVVGLAATTLGVGSAAACSGDPGTPRTVDGPAPDPAGRRQGGVDLPVPRQQHVHVGALDLDRATGARRTLAQLGDAVTRELRQAPTDAVLTVTVGVAPRLVRDAGRSGPGSVDLPDFAREQIRPRDRGGDVLVQVAADDEAVVAATMTALRRAVPALLPRWAVAGFRGDVVAPFDDVGRNLVGFHDGTAIPRTTEALDADVWTGAGDPVADATVCVVRRMPLDVERFTAMSTQQQEQVIGRRKGSGKPLSGGGPTDDVNLQAKSDAGVYDIGLDAHVRRAHPFVGGAGRLMLRRSYSYDDGDGDRGQLFICFQREVDMFVATQRSLDEGDALMDFTRTTASGTWLVLPWEPGTRLGDALWA